MFRLEGNSRPIVVWRGRNFPQFPVYILQDQNGDWLMTLESLIGAARSQGASDLHLEAGLPAALRVRGDLQALGEPIPPGTLLEMARQAIGPEAWPRFLERRSHDFSRTIAGVRCRINVLQTCRGVGFAIRLLASFQATLDKLNLHPDLKRLVNAHHGLILLTGPTGCGKSSTLAGLVQEINLSDTRHIVTIESPIEYMFRPRMSFIRQREVGRDTPSFEQALLDSLREDPDVLVVGEMRDPETMRLTLSAAETGHLVLATMHSATCAEALARMSATFPPETQNAVRAQLADCLVAVVAQRLRYRSDVQIRVPELEILIPTHAVRSFIRQGDFFKISQVLETGAESGSWTFQRYQNWLDGRKHWHVPNASEQAESDGPEQGGASSVLGPVPRTAVTPAPSQATPTESGSAVADTRPGRPPGPIEIEPVEGGLSKLLKEFEQ
jgi:twitching motility protein PilT